MRSRARMAASCAATSLLLLSSSPPALADGYALSGDRVDGEATLAQAPTITPGQVQDALPRPDLDEGTRIFRIAVPGGSRLHASVTAIPPGPEEPGESSQYLGVNLDIMTSDGESCEAQSTDNIGDEYSGTEPVLATASTGVAGEEDQCPAGDLFVVATRSGEMHADAEIPFELRTAIEPVDPGEPLPAPPTGPRTDTGPPPIPVDGDGMADVGASYAVAAPLEEGSHRLRLAPDAIGYVSIPVAAGQRLRWRVEVASDEHGDPTRRVHVQAWNPMRMPVPLAQESDAEVSARTGEVLGAGFAAPVSPRNRESEDPDVAGVWMPGRQVLSLRQTSPPQVDEDTGELIELEGSIVVVLTVEVEGDPWQDPAERGALGTIAAAPWGRIGAGALALVLLGAAISLGGLGLLRR